LAGLGGEGEELSGPLFGFGQHSTDGGFGGAAQHDQPAGQGLSEVVGQGQKLVGTVQ